jgi:sulfhydrogenase subunit alpha
MSLPDYLGASSALTLAKEHRTKINDALKIITLGNKIVEEFGGREMHPFLKIHEDSPHKDFSDLLTRLKETKPIILETIQLFSSLQYQNLERKSEYISLKEKDIYATISGKIYAGEEAFVDDDYKTHLKENIKEYATSKFVLHNKHAYSAGAIARISNNSNELDDETKQILKELNLTLPVTNPHHNLICQALEILNSTNRIIELLENPPTHEKTKELKIKAGTGVSAVEAPRGTLFHEYKINKKGEIEYCNIVTPTAQNLNQMESDITLLVNTLLNQETSQGEIVSQIEKLIRSYDPCFSCSTHFLKVKWL